MRKLIEAAHTEAWEILTEYRDVLDTLAGELLEKETLHREELQGDLRRREEAARGSPCSTTSVAGCRRTSRRSRRRASWPSSAASRGRRRQPEPAFKAAIARGQQAAEAAAAAGRARTASAATALRRRQRRCAPQRRQAHGPTQPDYGAPAGWHAPGWPPQQSPVSIRPQRLRYPPTGAAAARRVSASSRLRRHRTRRIRTAQPGQPRPARVGAPNAPAPQTNRLRPTGQDDRHDPPPPG